MRSFIFVLLAVNLFASNSHLKKFQKHGLKIVDGNKTIIIKRLKHKDCGERLINPGSVFGGSYADKEVPIECKKTFVTTLGVLQPMQLFRGVKTVGELEVLEHIKKAQQKPDKFVLVDVRTNNWFKQMTIPTAVNLPYNEIYEDDMDDFDDEDEIEDFDDMLEILGIIQRKTYLDFSRAKSTVVFCNASWCSQSQKAILKLLNIGYPEEKLLWYRGGMQDWLINGFTITKQ